MSLFVPENRLDGNLRAEIDCANKSEYHCRYCLEPEIISNLLSLCACRGSIKYVHEECISRWISQQLQDNKITNTQMVKCEICNHPLRMRFKLPKWFPHILSMKSFWKMLAELTLSIWGMLWWVKELIRLRTVLERGSKLAKRVFMKLTGFFIVSHFSFDQFLPRVPVRKLRPWTILTKSSINITIIVSCVYIMFSWVHKFYRIIGRNIRAICAERSSSGRWHYESLD